MLHNTKLTPRLGCTLRMPIVDFGASTGTLEFRKSTLGAPPGAAGSDFDLVSSFFAISCKETMTKEEIDFIYKLRKETM